MLFGIRILRSFRCMNVTTVTGCSLRRPCCSAVHCIQMDIRGSPFGTLEKNRRSLEKIAESHETIFSGDSCGLRVRLEWRTPSEILSARAIASGAGEVIQAGPTRGELCPYAKVLLV